MGGSQSSRKLTINNEEGVIQISTDLVQRLTHSSRETAPPDYSASEGRTAEPVHVPKPIPPPAPVPTSAPAQTYPVQSYPEYTITAYKMQQQKELELQAQDQYWQKRLENLKLTHEKINRVFQEEYKRAMDEIANAKGKKTISLDSAIPPCCSDKEKVLKCYRENPREILKCSNVVEEFNNCVDQRRAMVIAARC